MHNLRDKHNIHIHYSVLQSICPYKSCTPNAHIHMICTRIANCDPHSIMYVIYIACNMHTVHTHKVHTHTYTHTHTTYIHTESVVEVFPYISCWIAAGRDPQCLRQASNSCQCSQKFWTFVELLQFGILTL